jgi:hypothetical protein
MRGSEFAELKAFVAIVERQSFARAADIWACHLPHLARASDNSKTVSAHACSIERLEASRRQQVASSSTDA